MEQPHIKYVKINDQLFCQIIGVTQNNEHLNECLIFVMDVSASMGKHINNAHQLFKNLIISNEIKNTMVATFGERSNINHFTNKDIVNWKCPHPESSTLLSETFKNVFNYIDQIKEKTLFQILIISDGDVKDLEDRKYGTCTIPCTLSYVSTINPSAFEKHIIQVSSIRIGIEGDTRALTCFSVFHNHPICEQQIIDIPSCTDINNLDNALLEIFVNFGIGRSCYSNKITSSANNLQRFPSDPINVNTLDINNDDYFIINSNDASITIDNQLIELIKRTTLNESSILNYMKLIEQKIRTIKVLNINSRNIVNIIPFLKGVQEILNNNENVNNKSLSKIAQIKRNAIKTQGTIINKILQLINLDNVDKLNAQQQAQFLRQIDSSTQSGRRLAKRSNESSDDIHSIVTNSIKKILTNYKKVDNESEDNPRSFFSISSSIEILNEAFDELKDDLDMLSLEDLLKCLGQVGLCFKAKIGNYPDPWQFKVSKVYNCFLGQHDIYEASVCGGTLTLPGSQEEITGVDVIYYNGNEVYFKERAINKLHCSIAMRKVAADIPNDDIALKVAVIYQQIHQLMKQPLEKSIIDLWLNIKTLKLIINERYKDIFGEEVIAALVLPNMDAYFTGDLNISSINKIIAISLVCDLKGKVDLCKLARSLLSLDCYHHIKSLETMSRDKTISSILQINMKNRTLAQEPFEAEPEKIEFYDKYDYDNIITQSKTYFNDYSKIINFIKFLSIYYNSTSLNDLIINVKTTQNKSLQSFFGIKEDVPLDLFISANIIQAILSPKLESRVNITERIMLLQPLITLSDIDEYLKNLVINIYKNDYERQLILKLFNEKERESIVQIETLVWACEIETFVLKLNDFIPQRDSEKYQLLMKAFNETNDIPILQEKVWVICLCQIAGSETIVWNRGNMCSKLELPFLMKIWNYDKIGSLIYNDMYTKWRNAARIHWYRESDKPNRHGHCNSNPYLR